jgi:hypothetical protein
MKKLTLVFLALLSFNILNVPTTGANHSKSQPADDHVIIQRRRIVLVRSPELEKQFPERKRAVVTYPVISGLSDPTVLRRVRSVINFKNIFDYSLREYREDAWLSEFSYVVNFNSNYLLDLTFTQSGVGAYPDVHTRHFLINLRDGNLVRASDAFVADRFEGLASLVDKQLQLELKDIARENATTMSDYKEFVESQGELRFEEKNLDHFSVRARGIMFLYDAGFPHAIKAFEPKGDYFFSYAQLKPFIKADGPLGQFVR